MRAELIAGVKTLPGFLAVVVIPEVKIEVGDDAVRNQKVVRLIAGQALERSEDLSYQQQGEKQVDDSHPESVAPRLGPETGSNRTRMI